MSAFFPSSPGGSRNRRLAETAPRPAAWPNQGDSTHAMVINQSHERCQALGLSRIERPDFSPLGRSDLTVARDRNQRLYSHAAPVMEMLYEQIVNSESMVVLTDATGTILHSIGDDDFLSRANKVALSPGANWSEAAKGTNAVGTALVDEVPTLVHADEHFMHANHFLTCSAAPILDPRGNILGVLDVSGDQRSYHQHTMALVKMSARMIENHWLSDDYRNVMRLHFHSRVEFIGTLMEGILAVAPDGKIVGANRGALEQLGMSGAALRMHALPSLFGVAMGTVVDRFRSPLAVPMPVQLSDGRQFHIQGRFNSPVWSSPDAPGRGTESGSGQVEEATVRTASGAGPSAETEGGADARHGAMPAVRAGLKQLQTGDAQVDTVIQKIRRVLNRDIPILVLGETGTGKELLARAIHQDSDRSRQPFVAVNCASIPDTLIEAELFGYEEGAFTGARRKGAPGKIVQANGGTLFLDEIGDMPLPLQAHLLRVLQERQVTPLGSNKSVSVDVAIICATHRNLREMIEAKSFREDLYYRLNGLAVRIPSLRERTDLMVLVQRILDRQTTDRRLSLSSEVVKLFQHYHWPGNVRQLFNVLRTAAVMAAGESVITRDHLSDDFIEDALQAARSHGEAAAAPHAGAAPAPMEVHLQQAQGGQASLGMGAPMGVGPVGGLPHAAQPGGHPGAFGTGSGSPFVHPFAPSAPTGYGLPGGFGTPAGSQGPREAPMDTGRSLQDMEIEAIRRAVEAAGGNISEASKRLGISRNTIYRKLRWQQGGTD
ncbi:sigma-54-dependent Fis family transcriptional regulator [Ideonella livida]|uniref:GAF domain-containing protein n=1 Tax=Ideonella livida TaxID=2707176 RepID=A0A7C9TJ41_9BURK|nr:sigma-54-dependent Fis family transcriptional regulator [Ideonella livida]NDY90784.1 GAF domain-containing protein [Ideonella livida]